MFSDELFDQMRAAYRPDDMTGAGGLNSDDDDAGDEGMLAAEEETVTHDGSVDPGPDEDLPVGDALQLGASRDGSMTSSRRRRRGTRGSGASSVRSNVNQSGSSRKWRSGAIPTAPTFEGDIDTNPYCLRHYRRRLMRWVRITREYLPANEQALRAREQLQGEAEIELEETPDEKYDCDEGISLLLADLEHSFGERELFRQGGVIREFESIGRLQGETVTSFVRRFRLLEGRLKDNKVPSYPEEARVVKLLDGLRLDERSTSALLLAAGNRYNMQAIQEAIRIQYPVGMSVTGIPKPAAVNNKKAKSNYSKWSSMHTSGYEDYDEAEYEALVYEYEPGYDEAHEYEQADEEPEGDVEYYYDEEDGPAAHANDQSGTAADEASSSPLVTDSLIQAVNALTVTSRQLAEITKARGFYQLKNDKGKGLKGKSAGKAKGKGKNFVPGKGYGKQSGGKKGKSAFSPVAQGKGKPSAVPTRQNLDQQRQRLNNAACLGCGSTSHWIKDCPHNNKFSAQLATVGVTLNAEGIPTSECLMVSTEAEKSYQLPELCETNHIDRMSLPLETIQQNEYPELDLLPDGSCSIPQAPKVLIQYANKEAFLMIADTGCQRQVAGLAWHLQRQKEIYPLQPLHAKEQCRFSFGPNAGVPSKERLAYPAGLGGAYAMLGISLVESNAPALFSRPAFEKLGAIPNLLQGGMHYVALQTCSRLYLSPCGHLAIRIDEWPSSLFTWPPEIEHNSFEDAWSPDALKLETTSLQQPEVPSCPPPHAASSSTMASQVARFDAPCPGVCLLGSAGSDPLRSCEHASQYQGQGSEVVFPPQTATAMLLTTSALMLQSTTQNLSYVNKPNQRTHQSGLRSYGAGKIKAKICDLCGSRWVVEKSGLIQAQPKASPTAKTPLFETKSKAKSKAMASSHYASSDEGSGYYSQHSWQPASAAHQHQSTNRLSTASKSRARPLIAGMTEEEVVDLHRRYEDLIYQQEVHNRAAQMGVSPEEAEAELWWEQTPGPGENYYEHMEEDEEELMAG